MNATLDNRSPIPRAEAREIAESIVGPVSWDGAEGCCACPGKGLHTTRTASTDCKVVCEAVAKAGGVLKPGVYCFHGSCATVVEAASFQLRCALGKRCPSARPNGRLPMPVRMPKPEFDSTKLERIASKLEGADSEWFAGRSRKRVDNRTPVSFLHELYRVGESVVIFDVFKSQGQALWTHREPPFDACELDQFRTGKPCGVWFLANPVTGEYEPNDQGELSRRSWQNVTAWRYLVLESDLAKPVHWLAAIAQMPLPISAIYTSGGKSIHALLRLDANSKAQWDAEAALLKPALITLGADKKAISAVRLTRLPCCQRMGSADAAGAYVRFPEPRLQQLIYLNGNPDNTPICEQEPI